MEGGFVTLAPLWSSGGGQTVVPWSCPLWATCLSWAPGEAPPPHSGLPPAWELLLPQGLSGLLPLSALVLPFKDSPDPHPLGPSVASWLLGCRLHYPWNLELEGFIL